MKFSVALGFLICASALGSQSTVSGPFTMSGQVQIGPAQNSPATVRLVPSTLTFSGQNVGTTSGTQTVTLTNLGTTLLTVTSISITGADPGDFAQTNTCGAVIGGGTCTITVDFTPSTAGTRSANVSIADNAPGSPQTIPLSGTGIGVSPIFSVSPTSLAFGTQSIGASGTAQTLTITNTGDADLIISGIAPAGANASDFSETNTCSTVNPTGGAVTSCTIQVTFTPGFSGSRSGTISITDNAAGSPHSVPVSGTGAGVVAAGTGFFLTATGGGTPQSLTAGTGTRVSSTGSGTLTTVLAGSGVSTH